MGSGEDSSPKELSVFPRVGGIAGEAYIFISPSPNPASGDSGK